MLRESHTGDKNQIRSMSEIRRASLIAKPVLKAAPRIFNSEYIAFAVTFLSQYDLREYFCSTLEPGASTSTRALAIGFIKRIL